MARLHMDNLKEQPTKGDLKRALRNLPKGSDGLETTYNIAIDRIRSQSLSKRELAFNVLRWVVYCARPLSVTSLLEALTIRPECQELDEDFRPDPQLLDSLCMGLVAIDHDTQSVGLVHYTTKEYFNTQKELFTDPHKDLFVACTQYLLFGSVRSRLKRDWESFFYHATYSWAIHAKEMDSLEALQVLQDESKAYVWMYGCLLNCNLELDLASRTDTLLHLTFGVKFSGIHVAAFFGLEKALDVLIAAGVSPEKKDSRGRMPLYYAIFGNQMHTKDLLLEKYHANPKAKISGITNMDLAQTIRVFKCIRRNPRGRFCYSGTFL